MTDKKTVSTDDFDPQRFRPHGRVNFTREGDLVICEAVGPFNKELIEALASTELDLIQDMKKLPHWGDIVVIKNSALASPEALQAFTEYLTELGRNNMNSLVTAMVIDDDVEGGAFMATHLVNAYAEAGINLQIFKKLNEAKIFVKLHL
jgi:hypothetical protein